LAEPGPHPRTGRRDDHKRGSNRTHDRIISSDYDNHRGASTPLGLTINTDARKADRQTPTGAEALVIGAAGDPTAVGRALEKELAQVGVAGPCVEVRVVDRLERQAVGKVRRFQPIPG
jgi:hypothetical protein